MSLETELAELICSPIPLLEEIILNPNSSEEELNSIILVLKDIIHNSNSLLNTVIQKISNIRNNNHIRSPIFYKDKLPSTCINKYMVEKIWGLPFMRQREPWPKDTNGEFLLFFCQIFDVENPNTLHRIFIEKCDEMLGNYMDANDAFAFLPQIKHKYIIMPIELDKSKWLKSTAMVFKHMPHFLDEHFIQEWELCSKIESKKYIYYLNIKARLDAI